MSLNRTAVVILLAATFVLSACAAEPAHPSLLFSTSDIPALKNKVQQGWCKDALAAMKDRADDIMKIETNPYPLYKRDSVLVVGRILNHRVLTLVMAGILTDNKQYIEKAVAIAVSAAKQSTAAEYATRNDHLSVGDGAHAFAMAYDCLWPWLNQEQKTLLQSKSRSSAPGSTTTPSPAEHTISSIPRIFPAITTRWSTAMGLCR